MRKLATNCPNCGGVLSNGLCPYCGTKVRYANEIDIEGGFNNQPVEVQLNIKQGNSVLVLPLRGYISEVVMRTDHCSYYGDGRAVARVVTQREVDFTFNGVICD